MQCKSCQNIFSFDEKYFTKDKSRRFGFKPLCLECNRKSCAERRLRNLEESREKDRQRYANHPVRKESAKSRARAYYENNREQVIENVARRAKIRRAAGLPRVINEEKRKLAAHKNRTRCRNNYHSDIEKSRAKERSRLRTEKDREARRIWRQNNPGKIRANLARRKGLLNSALVVPFTKADIDSLREKQDGCCLYCNVKMTADGRTRGTIDHRLAVSKGGSNEPENIALACWECNIAKGTQDFDAFLTRSDRPRFELHPPIT